jgi:hypothetical protein
VAPPEGDETCAAVPRSEVRRSIPELATVRQVRAARSIHSRIPIVVLADEKLRAAPLDCRSGFIVSLLDGKTTVEELLDVSGMPVEETLAIVEDLRLRGIIEF